MLTIILAGCRRSAAPPIAETIEDEEAAAIQEAEENTESMEAEETETTEPEETVEEVQPTEETAATMEPEEGETPQPTPEPTQTEQVPTEESTTPAETTTTAPTTTTPGIHVVKSGENLFRIAQQYGTTVDAIAQANNITNPSMIYVGQELKIPSESGSSAPTTEPTEGEKTYVVQPGDNLFRIALRYGVDQYYLARYNGIENPSMIYVGQVLKIP